MWQTYGQFFFYMCNIHIMHSITITRGGLNLFPNVTFLCELLFNFWWLGPAEIFNHKLQSPIQKCNMTLNSLSVLYVINKSFLEVTLNWIRDIWEKKSVFLWKYQNKMCALNSHVTIATHDHTSSHRWSLKVVCVRFVSCICFSDTGISSPHTFC